ncbi:MAG: hypothetical protein IJN04_04355 [Clostridia bacterium]|nr:hypothetical protein [Clostridia bacterium]
MRKARVLSLLCVLTLLLSTVAAAVPVQAAVNDTVYIRKHISFLYDNSGSMKMDIGAPDNLKWCYASYAAQMFTGLLNDTDSLTFTFMNPLKGDKNKLSQVEVDLAADRQQQVKNVLDITNYANSGTPFARIADTLQVLTEKKGLKADAEINNNQVNQNEQHWLVLTTDGNFTEVPSNTTLVKTLKEILEKYSTLQVVYFGIGTKGDTSDEAAKDLRDDPELSKFPNFTAVFAEEQEEIVSTMRSLANRISGRYTVTEGVNQKGAEVTITISRETSPIRNVAVLAQKTAAVLEKAIAESGEELTVARPAVIKYPYNDNYENLDPNTKGGTTALITCEDGKLPPGTITLTFSEPVSMDDLSLMYEPAICVNLTLQRKNAAGEWEDVPYGEKVLAEDTLRVNYEICEDGTNAPVDSTKLPGVTTAQIVGGGQDIKAGESFRLPFGAHTITATVSMMDGSYVVSTSRNVTVQSLSAYTFEVSDPLEFYPNELATNSSRYIEFTIFHEGKPANGSQLSGFAIEAGDLQGLFTTPEANVYRFTPQDSARPIGEYVVALKFQNTVVSQQTVKVKQEDISYSATAGDPLVLFTNETATNQKPIVFTVTQARGNETGPMPEEAMGEFRIEAKNADGKAIAGETTYHSGGQIHFTTHDGTAEAGEYAVTLYWKDTQLAQSQITVMQYNAVFTAEVFRVGDDTLDRFHLQKNENGLAFVIYADGEPLTENQLQAMLNQQVFVKLDPKRSAMELQIRVGEHEGKTALLAIPTTATKSAFLYFLQKPFIAWGLIPKGAVDVVLDVQTVHGTSATGTMNVTSAIWEDWLWFLVLAGILVLAFIFGWIVVCNIYMNRIAPGEFRNIQIRVGVKEAIVEWDDVTYEHKRKFYLTFACKPEVVYFTDLKFTAVQEGVLMSDSPCCEFDAEDDNLPHYRVGSVTQTSRLLELIDRYGLRIPLEYFRNTLSNSHAVTLPLDEGQQHATCALESGGYLMRKDGDYTYSFWLYERKKDNE